MKKKYFAIILFSFLNLMILNAQSTTHYQLTINEVDGATAQNVLNLLEANIPVYANYLGGKTLPVSPLNINFYRNNSRFNDALAPQGLPAMRSDFIYLDFNDPARNVLYLYPLDIQDINGQSSPILTAIMMEQKVNRYGFLQYALNVIPKAPAWFREGLALQMEAIEHDESGKAELKKERRDFLETLQTLQQENPMSLDELFALTDGMNGSFIHDMDRNLSYAWGFINFLLVTDKQSILAEVANSIDDSKNYEENRAAVATLLSAKNLETEFTAYLTSLTSYTDLIEAGKKSYTDDNLASALTTFKEAAIARSDLYTPFYYLGLIAFRQGSYDEAKKNYDLALKKGADEALINFNLGFVAFKERDFALATTLLEQAKASDYAKYGAKAEALLKTIPAQESIEAEKVASGSGNAEAVTPYPATDTTDNSSTTNTTTDNSSSTNTTTPVTNEE